MENKKSLIRVILVDNEYNEHLIYENIFLLTDSLSFVIDKEYFETGYLSDVIPLKIIIIIDSATLYIDKFSYGVLSQMKSTIISSIKYNLISNKNQKNISIINSLIKNKNLLWVAGETLFSQLTYQEKKQYFGDTLPNLFGFEYYVGGIFEIPNDDSNYKTTTNKSGDVYVQDFDWRNRHGINWITPVKNQTSCGACWAFSTVGAVEGLINLYYNRRIDMNLSEQQIVSCTPSVNTGTENEIHNDCRGGNPYYAFKNIVENGVVNDNCFPYTATNGNCNQICNNPTERIKIYGQEMLYYPNNDIIKKIIIQKGVLSATIYNWNHAMALVGYGTVKLGEKIYEGNGSIQTSPIIITNPDDSRIGKTYFIFKNSWGANPGSGNSGGGYVYAIVNPNVINIPLSPITSLNYTNADIVCEDRDGDGYYNWGIGPKPATCPTCPDEEDCDDSNPMFGPYDERYGCSILCDNYVYSETPLEIRTSQTWDEPKFFNQNIIIKPNVTLTIKSTIRFGKNVSIDINLKGKLIVDGGTLTNACPNDYWQGINVIGHKLFWQTPILQGYVEFKNNAIIENARNAVSLWKPEVWHTTGGIVKASNTIFRNNLRSVEFLSYQNTDDIINGNPIGNVSEFDNCIFEWNENLIAHDKTELSHVTMWDVDGVKFNKCNFINNDGNKSVIHHGISSIQSGFTVDGDISDKNTFENLEYGVRAEDLKERTFSVNNMKFNNNFCGVFASSANNFKVRNCDFNMEPKKIRTIRLPDYISGVAFGLFSDVSTGYTIDNNNFKGSLLYMNGKRAQTIGLQIVNSGDAANIVEHNNFENLYCASQALGQNRSINAEPDVVGLRYRCNSFSNCDYGIYISSHSGINNINGVCSYQGLPGFPSWNTFNNNSNVDMCNVNCPTIFYFYPQGIANLSPSTCNSNINTMGSSAYTNSCESNNTHLFNKSVLYTNLTTLNNEYLLLLYNYNSLLDGGQKDVLLEKLEDSWSGSDWDLRNSYMQKSPYLSSDVLIELVKSEKLPLAMCTEILLSNSEATQKDDFIEFMNNEDSYLTLSAKTLIEDSWSTKTFRANVENNISAKLSDIEFVSRDLINVILNDTLGLNINEYRSVLSDMRNIASKFELADSYIGRQEYNTARSLLLNLQPDEENQKYYSEEIESYLNYLSIMENADSLNNLNENSLIELSNYNTRAGQKAKSILYFNGVNINYHPVVLFEENTEKLLKPSVKLSSLMKADIILSPNPAKDYITLSYDLDSRKTEYTIRIYDNKGINVYSGNLKENKGIKNIDTRGFSSGTYVYNVENGTEKCKSGKFIIIR